MPRKDRFQSWSVAPGQRLSQEELCILADDIQGTLDKGEPYNSWQVSTIARVPKNLCEVQEKAFNPRIVSIGPFHYQERKSTLQAMEVHKQRFLAHLLGGKIEGKSSCGEPTMAAEAGREESIDDEDDKYPASRRVSLKELVDAMEKLESRARACYSERFDKINSKEFVKMLVMDGCFLVVLMRLYYQYKNPDKAQGINGAANSEDEPLFKMPWMIRTLQHDLLMLENQLPFFVLEKLFDLTEKAEGQAARVPLEHLAINFFDPLLPRGDPDPASMLSKRDDEYAKTDYAHLLSIFRSTFLKKVRGKVEKAEGGGGGGTTQSNHEGRIRIPICGRLLKHFALENEEPGVKTDEEQGLKETPPSDHKKTTGTTTSERQLKHFASELQERGVKFKERKEGSDLLEVLFHAPTLEMLPLAINDNTLPMFLNFLAYEQCDELPKPFFTNYFIFLDNLVGSPEDVKVLRKAGILNHVFGSDENVANLVQKLCRELVYVAHHSYLRHEVKKVNEYCEPYDKSWILSNWRDMIHKYFSSPWTMFSVLAAIIALVLTLVQTIFAVYPYYHPN